MQYLPNRWIPVDMGVVRSLRRAGGGASALPFGVAFALGCSGAPEGAGDVQGVGRAGAGTGLRPGMEVGAGQSGNEAVGGSGGGPTAGGSGGSGVESAGNGAEATGGPSSGGGGAGGASEPTSLVWPNEMSSANSDAWLREHHDEIEQLRPRVLILNAYNARPASEVAEVADKLVYALGEGSRYHGYSEPTAPVFLSYEIERIVDLTDDSGEDLSQVWPRTGDGGFHYGGIFTQEFADLVGYQDPEDPGHNLTLCELFEGGFINEVWTVGDSAVVFESKSRGQVYDAELQPIAGEFNNCAGNGCYDPGPAGHCQATVRLVQLNPSRGPGCERDNGVTAANSCENYGMGNGETGQDAISFYSYDTVRALNEDPRYSDCGGGWQIYMRQSFPGYQNLALDLDGAPMKNWWPFLFY